MSEADPLRILIVDDDPSALALLGRHLTADGHEVLRARDGREAMKILLAEGPPMVITNWMMPEMDGMEFCRTLRQHEGVPFAYVIILTATTGQNRIVEAFSAGADDYLCKPLKPKELLSRVRAGERIIKLHHTLEARNREVHRVNAELAVLNNKMGEVNTQLNRMATVDELTGLVNRRAAFLRFNEHWSTSGRHGEPLACILADIDHFKSCNDVYTHAVGDLVLKETAKVLQAAVRQGETVCRIGGEEFLILCPKSSEAAAAVAAERLRREVEARVIVSGDLQLRVTISVGVAERTAEMTSPDDLLRTADAAMYAAKDAGRNIVCVASGDSGEAVIQTPERQSYVRPRDDSRVSQNSGANTMVLVVDDDASARSLSRAFLQREGYQISEAVDGLDALGKIQRDPPDVIIMDVAMPNMDGLECTRRLKENPETQSIPIIIVAARTDGVGLAECLEAGANEYISKPLSSGELVLRVHTMVCFRRELERSNAVRAEQSRALEQLLTFSQGIATAQSLDAVLDATVAAAGALTCSRCISIMLADPAQVSLHVAGSLGIDPQTAAKITVPIGTGISGAVFASQQTRVINSAGSGSQHHDGPDSALFPNTPCISTPLCAPECVVGVLNIAGRLDAQPFGELDLNYVDLICNLAASAIHDYLSRNARDDARNSIVTALVKLAESRDNDTGRHLDRVTRFCVLLAQELGASERYRSVITGEFLRDLHKAVPLHDIGKVAVPDRILKKPGPLTKEETTVMRTHADVGATTLRSVIERTPGAFFLAMAEQIAQSHHEWYNGEGYPCGIAGDEIPLAARITAVADVYDALTSKRVYKDVMPHEQAMAIITTGAGTQFDPDVVEAFQRRERDFRRLATELADTTSTNDAPVGLDSSQADASPVVVEV